MGQYFKAVNLDKREVVCPWCLGGGAKLWEWAANPQGAIFTLLLRKSTATGGGDYQDPIPARERRVELDTSHPESTRESFIAGIARAVAAEGQPVMLDAESVVGRWAGDRVMLVGDYDESKLWDQLPAFRNITTELVKAWNDFIEIDDMKLTLNATCSCQQRA